MQLGFTTNAPMTRGLGPIRMAQQPPDMPPSRAGNLRVHRQPRTTLTRFEIERAAQVPAVYDSTLLPRVYPHENADTRAREEFMRGLFPPEAAMHAKRLAVRAAEIRAVEDEILRESIALAAYLRRLRPIPDELRPPGNFSTII